MADPQQFLRTSGATDSVWVHTEPYSNRPQFSKLSKDIETDVCIVGSGISGISIAYELVNQGVNVVMIEARDILSGETGRTSGHLSDALDDGYTLIESKHGRKGAKLAAQSHGWALRYVGQVENQLGIDCEYRQLPGYEISQYPKGTKEHDKEISELKSEVKLCQELGMDVKYQEDYAIKGWTGRIDQRDAAIFATQATFHPTKYLIGVLKHLTNQPNFQCYTHTRMISLDESGGIDLPVVGHVGSERHVKIQTLDGNTIRCGHAVEATCVPLQKLAIVAQEEYFRTYCIAIRVPKGSVEDCLIYDQAEAYKYLRITPCDDANDYLVVGGCDHKVGQEGGAEARYKELEEWTKERFTQATSTDYKWSGQIFEPVDAMAFIGRNQGDKNIFVVTGDSGNGLTHGVIAGRLISDEILGKENEWAGLYNPKRVGKSMLKSLPDMVAHDVQINAQYKRFLQSDIEDVGQIPKGSGGVLNPKTKKPIAVYKDEEGQVHRFSALCPHLKGVVCWNDGEKSWDCPVHGSRFSKDGVQIIGPAFAGLGAVDESGEAMQKVAMGE